MLRKQFNMRNPKMRIPKDEKTVQKGNGDCA